jgi:galactofuranose transport system permease protein
LTGFKLLLRRILPQLITLALVVGLISIMFPGFFEISLANGRLYGSPVDIFNRGAPVALLAIGMTLVIATGGIDLSVGAVMAICGAVADRGDADPDGGRTRHRATDHRRGHPDIQ